MVEKIKIKNFKSIVDIEIPLARINVFIGENGCGKSNILEAAAMLAAAKSGDLTPEELYNRGVRVAKPTLMFNSFIGHQSEEKIDISAHVNGNLNLRSLLGPLDKNDIFSKWNDEIKILEREAFETLIQSDKSIQEQLNDSFKRFISENGPVIKVDPEKAAIIFNDHILERLFQIRRPDQVVDFVIYNAFTSALRGSHSDSKRTPLGINGEGLDVLISQFNNEELELLNKYNLISWVEELTFDSQDILKYKGHKLGRSSSQLYFLDRFMQEGNNIFSAENANEGVLHVLFHLALFISKKTPSFFGIDNIDATLNPKLCRELIKSVTELAKITDKQAMITTHNPAVLDGLNLHDPEQRLFVVKRRDNGQTAITQIRQKPDSDPKYKLSEMWMRGLLGGLPTNF